MLLSEFREDLAVEHDAVLLEAGDEGGVGLVALLTDSGVEAHDPEGAVVTLLVLAVIEGVLACVYEGLLCKANLC